MIVLHDCVMEGIVPDDCVMEGIVPTDCAVCVSATRQQMVHSVRPVDISAVSTLRDTDELDLVRNEGRKCFI